MPADAVKRGHPGCGTAETATEPPASRGTGAPRCPRIIVHVTGEIFDELPQKPSAVRVQDAPPSQS